MSARQQAPVTGQPNRSGAPWIALTWCVGILLVADGAAMLAYRPQAR